MHSAAMEGGFASPDLNAQSVFRAVMDAMAQPGTVRELTADASAPAPLSASAAAVVLTLCDHDTRLWLDPALREVSAVSTWIGFHVGAPITERPEEAQFAVVAKPEALTSLELFSQGSQDYPDRSTTLILQVDTLEATETLSMKGPGIKDRAELAAAPLPPDFVSQWQANNARFPRGIDVILAAPRAVICLPRTTHITSNGS